MVTRSFTFLHSIDGKQGCFPDYRSITRKALKIMDLKFEFFFSGHIIRWLILTQIFFFKHAQPVFGLLGGSRQHECPGICRQTYRCYLISADGRLATIPSDRKITCFEQFSAISFNNGYDFLGHVALQIMVNCLFNKQVSFIPVTCNLMQFTYGKLI